MLPELDRQVDAHEAAQLRVVLGDLAEKVQSALEHNLIGIYLKGSFALGAGDVHADVDFLVVTNSKLALDEESKVRAIHRQLPTRTEHWAHVLEGSYATIAQLRGRANPNEPWLYVDNGQTEMESSTHDNTETFRWILKHHGLAITGPPAASLLPEISTQVLRDEAAALAVQRHHDALADPKYLANGWGQPHEVLTNCRMLFSASTGQVTSKHGAARWCMGVLPPQWRDLIEAAIADRPNPWDRVHQRADPQMTDLTRRFIDDMMPRIAAAATGPILAPANSNGARDAEGTLQVTICETGETLAAASRLFNQYRHHYGQPSDDDERTLDWLTDMVQSKMLTVYTARTDSAVTGPPIGLATSHALPASLVMGQFWQLRDLFVIPGSRRQGTAAALVNAVRDAALAAGATRLSLMTEPDNQAAMRLYQRLGFRPVDALASLSLDLATEGGWPAARSGASAP